MTSYIGYAQFIRDVVDLEQKEQSLATTTVSTHATIKLEHKSPRIRTTVLRQTDKASYSGAAHRHAHAGQVTYSLTAHGGCPAKACCTTIDIMYDTHPTLNGHEVDNGD